MWENVIRQTMIHSLLFLKVSLVLLFLLVPLFQVVLYKSQADATADPVAPTSAAITLAFTSAACFNS